MKLSHKTTASFAPVTNWHNLTPMAKSTVLKEIANQGYLATVATSLMKDDLDFPSNLEFLAGQYHRAASKILAAYDATCKEQEGWEYTLSQDPENVTCIAMALAENIIDNSHERLMAICYLIVLIPN